MEEAKQNEIMKKEEQEKEDAAQIAESYVNKYCSSLEKAMAIDPLSDLKVECRKMTWEEFKYGGLLGRRKRMRIDLGKKIMEEKYTFEDIRLEEYRDELLEEYLHCKRYASIVVTGISKESTIFLKETD